MAKPYITILGALAILLTSCSEYHDEQVKLVLKSEIASCEEQNIHFKVVRAISGGNEQVDKFVLPVCESKECEELIYKVSQLDTNRFFEITGQLSKKGHNSVRYGCNGSLQIKITDCQEIEQMQ